MNVDEDERNALSSIFELVIQQSDDMDDDGFNPREVEDEDVSILSISSYVTL